MEDLSKNNKRFQNHEIYTKKCMICNDIISNSPIRCEDSFGLCSTCILRLEYDEILLDDLLNKFKYPVFIIDDEGIFQKSQGLGVNVLNTEKRKIVGHLGGTVIKCVYSELPGGCRQKVHCLGCELKKTVKEIYGNGKSVFHRKCFQFIKTPQGPKKVYFLISGKKLNEVVMLKVETMKIVKKLEIY